MKSRRTLQTKDSSTPARATVSSTSSTWLERYAVPIVLSAMEAQPVALILALLTRIFVGSKASPSLNAGLIALVALGLLWWAMLVPYFTRDPARKKDTGWLYLLGWFVAFAILVGPYLPSVVAGVNIFPALFNTAIITWFWRQSMRRTQIGFEYEQIARSFKVGLGILLAVLLIVVLFPELHTLADVLSSVFPIFFLSGLITLSLVRLEMLRSARRSSESPQSDPTRSWLLALTIFGVIMLAIVILIESLFSFSSFEFVIAALSPIWNGLGTLVSWILYVLIVVILSPIFYGISWLIGLIRGNGHPKSQTPPLGKLSSPVAGPKGPANIAPEIIALGRWVFLAIALIVLLLVVRAALNRFRAVNANDGIEEVRESLDARSLLGQRLRDWFNRRRGTKERITLEPLDPASARARYRNLLAEVALARHDLARLPTETPDEYEMRLRVYLEQQSQQVVESSTATPTDPAILEELTHLYARERYGGKQTADRQRSYLQSWVPHLIARLTGRTATRRNP
jgi:hypothetical protein